MLRRVGLDVTVGKVRAEGDEFIEATLMKNTKIIPDKVIDTFTDEYDLIVLPGGVEGAKIFAGS